MKNDKDTVSKLPTTLDAIYKTTVSEMHSEKYAQSVTEEIITSDFDFSESLKRLDFFSVFSDCKKLSQEPAEASPEKIPSVIETPYPSVRMRAYESNLPDVSLYPILDRHYLSINGWLCPKGKLYSCQWMKHKACVFGLGYQHEHQLEDLGYIKLSNCKWLVQTRFRTKPVTTEQLDTIQLWYEVNEYDIRHFVQIKNWSLE